MRIRPAEDDRPFATGPKAARRLRLEGTAGPRRPQRRRAPRDCGLRTQAVRGRTPGDGPRSEGEKRVTTGQLNGYTPPGMLSLRTVVIADDEPSMRLLVHATIVSD